MKKSELKTLIKEQIISLKEGKWNHNAVGKTGAISQYIDGLQSVSFYLDTEKQKWMYKSILSDGGIRGGYSSQTKVNEVPSEYEDAFDNGDIKKMTQLAKNIITPKLTKEEITPLKENPTYVKPVFGDGKPPQFFPQGQWTITNNFKVSPGGGWSMGFNKGELLRSDGKGKLEISNDKGKTWVLRRPPIQDTYTMDFHRYGRNPEERQMWNSVAQNISFK
jgi:hypothetical protein